jgi:hypothetical protein
MGMGPMTGRAAGYCAGYAVPGFMNPTPGRGLGMAWGRGGGGGMGMAWRRGRGRGSGLGAGGGWGFAPGPVPAPYAPPEPAAEQQLAALRSQADWLKQQMDAVNERIQALQDTEDKD